MTVVAHHWRNTHETFDRLRVAKREGGPQFVALFSGQSGESAGVSSYIRTKIVDDAITMGLFPRDVDRARIASLQRIAPHVKLSAGATAKTLVTSVLAALGDLQVPGGPTYLVWQHVHSRIGDSGAEIIFIEGIHHLFQQRIAGGGEPHRWGSRLQIAVAMDTLKFLLIEGPVPLVLVAASEARSVLLGDHQVSQRCIAVIESRV